MSQYKLKRDLFWAGKDGKEDQTIATGTVIDMSDEAAAPYLESGTLVAYDPNDDHEEVPRDERVTGDLQREFDLNGYHYEHFQTVEGDKYAQNGVEIGLDAFVNAWQTVCKQIEDQKRDAERQEQEKTSVKPVDPDANPNSTNPENVFDQHLVDTIAQDVSATEPEHSSVNLG